MGFAKSALHFNWTGHSPETAGAAFLAFTSSAGSGTKLPCRATANPFEDLAGKGSGLTLKERGRG
jgi:hypothetical protein